MDHMTMVPFANGDNGRNESGSDTRIYRRLGEILDELDSFEAAMLCIEVVIFIPTIFGNTLILLSVHRFKWLQTSLNALVANLAVSDLLMGMCLIPSHILSVFFGLEKLESVCLLNLMVLVSLLLVSLLSMLAISVERYYSVAFPWKHRNSKRHLFVKVFIVLCWLGVLMFCTLPILGWNTFVPEERTKCQIFNVWPKAMQYALNSVIIATISVKIVLFSLIVNIALNRTPTFSEQEVRLRMRRQLTKTYMLMAVSAIFIICWAPYCIVSFFTWFIESDDLRIIQNWTLNLGLLNSGLNWLIYGLKNEKFRKAFKLLLCGRRTDPRPSSVESVGEVSSQS